MDEYFRIQPNSKTFAFDINSNVCNFLGYDTTQMGFTYFQFDTFSYRSVERLLEKGDKEVIEKMQNEGILHELIIHFPSQIGTFLHKIALRPALIDAFANQLLLLDKN